MKWIWLVVCACALFSDQERLTNAAPSDDDKPVTDDVKIAKRTTTTQAPRHDIFAPNFKCTPGDKFINSEGCSCTCRASGKTAYCDRDDCQITIAHYVGKHRFRRDLPGEPNFRCTAGQSFKIDCNTCVCSADGKNAACTQKLCLRKRSVDDPLGDRTLDPKAPDFSCLPGEMFHHVDGCNRCFCEDSGKQAHCSELICTPPSSMYKDEEKNRMKRDDLYSLENLNPNAPGFTCEPGQHFRNECNRCTCLADGKLAKCTFKLCPPVQVEQSSRSKRADDLYSLINLDPNTPDFSCEPGQQFRAECNRCTCAADGKKARCTLKFCPPAPVPNRQTRSIVGANDIHNLERKRRSDDNQALEVLDPSVENLRCESGKRYLHIDGCNTCTCSKNGKLAKCTLKLCARRKRDQTTTCIPGTTFRDRDGCNDCFCTDDGTPACTEKACLKLPETIPILDIQNVKTKRDTNVRRTLDPAAPNFSCNPNESFNHIDGCNTCTCEANGKVAKCTLKLCLRKKRESPLPRKNPNGPCTPGEVFQDLDGCNTCTCEPNGKHAACTLKLCLKKREVNAAQSVPEDDVKILNPSAPDFTCTPGERFLSSDLCNYCKCVKSGTSATCTRKGCPPRDPTVPGFRCGPGQRFYTPDRSKTCICDAGGESATCTEIESENRQKRASASDAQRCTPGESFKAADGCNTCVCGNNGLRSQAACTLKLCLRKKRFTSDQLERRDPNVEGFTCNPGEQFLDLEGCNRCTCTNDGTRAACTKKKCLNLDQTKHSHNKREAGLPRRDPYAPDFSCTPGEQFLDAEGCNTCTCQPNGKPACTLKLCLRKKRESEPSTTVAEVSENTIDEVTTVAPKTCTPGESYYDGCNWCSCGDDGRPHACTLRFCFTLEKPKIIEEILNINNANEKEVKSDADSVKQKPEKEGSDRKKRNLMFKDPNAPNFVCNPGTQFYHADGCNTCLCGADGKTAACTLRQCLTQPTTTPKPGVAPSLQNCVPGSKFLSDDGCNTCTCSADGKTVGCTLMYCDKKTTPAPIGPGFRPEQARGILSDRFQLMEQNQDRLIFSRDTRYPS